MAMIGREVRATYNDIIAEGVLERFARFCAGWRSQPARGRLGDAVISEDDGQPGGLGVAGFRQRA
jgi:hypothetical protein